MRMSLKVPEAMEAVLQRADASATPLDEGRLWGEQMKAAPDPETATLEERRGTFAEISAWRFMRPHGTGVNEPWGIYWGPLASGTLADGKTPFYSPDVAEIDEEILTHWITRSSNTKHPVVKARYADIAWEIGRYLRSSARDRPESPKPAISLEIPYSLAQTATDGYLDAVESGLAENEYHSWVFLDRAIRLALSLKDSMRIQRAKTALFGYYQKMASTNSKFMWWRLNDLVEDREKALGLDDLEQKLVVESLDAALARSSDINDKDRFDPHQALNAADRLVKRLGNNKKEIQRATKRAGEAFEQIAEKASGLLAVSWLEDLIPRYRNAGLADDAVRIEQAIRQRADEAHGEMKRISTPVNIPKEELDKWVDSLVGSSLKEALERIGHFCTMREDNAKKSLQEMMAQAPLMSMMPVAIMSQDGFTEATVRSVEDDLEGRAIQHTADRFSWEAPFLYSALTRAKEKHGFDLEHLIEHIRTSPFFAANREAVLREGLAAWLADDPLKAIHVLVPQIEAACRDLLSALGAAVRKPNPQTGGSRVIGFGEVLSHDRFKNGVPKDIRFHLRTLYTDPRGINLRNHLAHGLVYEGILGMGVANWVVHSILMIVTLKMKQQPADVESPPDLISGGTSAQGR